MSRYTKQIRKGVRTVGTGIKMMGGADVPAYRLEYLTDSKKHPIHSNQIIIVPYIEMGRDNDCIVNFGDDLPMVSRKHASIERRGEDFYLRQLSATNQTLINGRPVKEEWYLRNEDEIQLSLNGPRIRFLDSATKTSAVGISERMQLFSQQALRPYRFALITILVLFVVSAALIFLQ